MRCVPAACAAARTRLRRTTAWRSCRTTSCTATCCCLSPRKPATTARLESGENLHLVMYALGWASILRSGNSSPSCAAERRTPAARHTLYDQTKQLPSLLAAARMTALGLMLMLRTATSGSGICGVVSDCWRGGSNDFARPHQMLDADVGAQVPAHDLAALVAAYQLRLRDVTLHTPRLACTWLGCSCTHVTGDWCVKSRWWWLAGALPAWVRAHCLLRPHRVSQILTVSSSPLVYIHDPSREYPTCVTLPTCPSYTATCLVCRELTQRTSNRCGLTARVVVHAHFCMPCGA